MAKCINCGEELTEGAKFCMYCGAQQEGPAPAEEAAVAEQADRVAELIENAPILEEAAPAAEPAEEPIPPAAPAEPAPLTNEERSARLQEQPSLEDMAAAAPKPAAPTYAPPRPETAPHYAYPPYEPQPREQAASGSYEPQPVQPRPLTREDPEKPGSKSKWQIMSTWGTFGAMLLMGIPVIGWIITIVWACGGCRKYAKRNLARAFLLAAVLCLVLTVAAGLVLRFAFPDILVRVFEFFNPGYTIEF